MPKSKSSVSLAGPAASRLEKLLHERGDYGHVRIHARADHLLVEVEPRDGQRYVIARATPLGGGRYGLCFRSHTGRWEPMPVSGSLEEIADGLTGPLGPYLDSINLA